MIALRIREYDSFVVRASIGDRERPADEVLAALARDIKQKLQERALSQGESAAQSRLDSKLRYLAWLLCDLRRPKKALQEVHRSLSELPALLEPLIAIHPLRLHSQRGGGGELGSAAAALLEIVRDELAQAPRAERERRKASRGLRGGGKGRNLTATARAAALDAAYWLVPAGTKPSHRRAFAFWGVDAGLRAIEMAKLEALLAWGWFEGLELAGVQATTPLYTDGDAAVRRSGESGRDLAVKSWDEALAALALGR